MITFTNDTEKLDFLKKYKLVSPTTDNIPTFYHYALSLSEVPSPCEVIGYERIFKDWAIICIKENSKIINIHSSYLLEMQQKANAFIKNVSKSQTLSTSTSESYIVIDIETTGFSHKTDEIIEIAAIKYSGSDIDEFHELVKINGIIPINISLLTGITNESIQDANSIDIVLPKFLSFIGDFTLVGHNIESFDVPFINKFCLDLGLPIINNQLVDTLYLSKDKLPELKSHKLSDLCKFYEIDTSNAHQALADCYMCDSVYRFLKSDVANNDIEIHEASNPFQKKLLSILDKIIFEKELPDNSLRLRENKNKVSDSYSILISEPPYPIGSERLGGEQSILKILIKPGIYIVDVLENVFNNIPCPEDIEHMFANKTGNSPKHILLTFKDDDINLYNYIESAIIYRLSIYRTAEATFGCCSNFMECSDAKKCVHENKLYSTACTYRKNLENNRIFYGKNRNID